MIKNKFLALTMAAAMTLATAVPAFAADGSGTTTVSLTVAPKNTYTMTVPSATPLDSTGEATQLTGGIKITDGTLENDKKLTVTATSKNDWYMVTTESDVSTKIGYALYSDAGTTAATIWEFTKEQANADGGATKDVYAKANADDLKAAASGVYSDVITFTAKVESATPMVSFNIDGSQYSVAVGTTWSQFVAGDGSSFLKISGNNVEQSNRSGFFVFTDSPFAKVNASDVITAQAYAIYAASN